MPDTGLLEVRDLNIYFGQAHIAREARGLAGALRTLQYQHYGSALFLVTADIIGTVAVTPSVENLAILGLIVLNRTFLSFSLEARSTAAGPSSAPRRRRPRRR
jgi:hypothetical protein